MRMKREKDIFALVCLILLFLPLTANTHPESGHMPDKVAETEYKIAIELNPEDIESRNRLGEIFYRKGRLKKALEQFEAVLKIKSDDFDAHKGIGLSLMKQGRHSDAVKWFKKALRLREDAGISKELMELEQLLDEER